MRKRSASVPRKKPPNLKSVVGKAKLPYAKRLKLGFAKVESDLNWLMGAFCDLLMELGEEKVVKALPFRGGTAELIPIEKGKVTRAYSLAFGLLNVAEEATAAAMRGIMGCDPSMPIWARLMGVFGWASATPAIKMLWRALFCMTFPRPTVSGLTRCWTASRTGQPLWRLAIRRVF